MARGRGDSRGRGFRGRLKRKRTAEPVESGSDGGSTSKSSIQNTKRVRWDGDVLETLTRDQEEQDESTDDSVTEKTCLAVFCQHGRIGAAYFDPLTCKIFVLEDSQERAHYDLTKMLLEQADPEVVLTSSKSEDGCIEVLRKHADSSGGVFQIRPHKDFLASKGRDRLLSLRMLSMLNVDDLDAASVSGPSSDSKPRNAYDFMRRRRGVAGDPTMQRWNASIRLANYAAVDSAPLCLSSIGALLDHIVRMRAVGELDDQGIGGLEVRGIEYLSLREVMQINSDALYSLQIFDEESHASAHSDKTKEGLSLFGILNNTRTTLGRALMREWLLRPSTSVPVINARHDAVACFNMPENVAVSTSMQGHLKGIKNVPKILATMRTGRAQVSDWQGLVKFAFHAVMLRDNLSELSHAGSAEVVQKLMDAMEVSCFKEVGTMINDRINWEESANAARVCIRPHIDEDLDKWKHIYHGIDTVLSKVAERISVAVPQDYAATLNVVYFPQLGFLVCVPLLDEWKNGEIEVLDGWSFQFSSEAQVYFKSQEMHGEVFERIYSYTTQSNFGVDLDTHIGDIHSAIVDREIEITQALLEKILVYDERMTQTCDICAELDCLLSFAQASRVYNYCRPSILEENVIDIRQGRHPLQELVLDTFVPNDAFIAGQDLSPDEIVPDTRDDSDFAAIRRDRNSIVVCTGANACGKSVYLKQVALIQFMAQIGCFVPAESATLGIVDKIFTRIQTRESVSRVQSAFMIDLNQVSFALRNTTPRSLILLDEFGKGTVSSDGAGLFCGLLTHLLARGTACPKVLAATHFHEVFRDDILSPTTLPITFVHMEVMITSDTGKVLNAQSSDGEEEDEDNPGNRLRPGEGITYLYRVGKGLGLNSHAAMCARIFGIPRAIVQRAQYVSHLLSIHELGLLLDEEMSTEERADLEDAEEVCRRFLAWKLESSRDAADGPVKHKLAHVLGRDINVDSF